MKKLISILLATLLIFSLSACGKQNDDEKNLVGKLDLTCNIYALNGPTGVGLVSLMDKNDKGETSIDYNFKIAAANDEIVGKILNKEADIAAVATNVASTIYKKSGGKIAVLAVNTFGVLNVVTKDDSIKSLADLRGKTVYCFGQGANPEFIISYILEENNLKVGTDVKIEYVSDAQALIPKVVKDNAIVIAPQPVATSITVQDSAAKIAINLNDEWDKVTDTNLVMGCIVARKEFIEKNPAAIKVFLKEYRESISFVNMYASQAGELCEKYKIIPKAAIATKAIPYCNIVFQSGDDLKKNLSAYLQFLYDKKPALVGDELPADDFYYYGG